LPGRKSLLSATGRIYVAHTVHPESACQDAIVVFDKNGKFLGSWGERFKGGRIQYFTLDGKHLSFSREGMRQPCHFDIRGDLMLVPDLNSVVTILDQDNRVVTQLGDGDPSPLRSHPKTDFIPGKFIHPHDAIFLQNGDILVAEWVPIGRIALLRKTG
jgi:hypothetical protein